MTTYKIVGTCTVAGVEPGGTVAAPPTTKKEG